MLFQDFSVFPFEGTVTVTFFDAVIASSTNARLLVSHDNAGVYFIPFDDIYFEFLSKLEGDHTRQGDVSLWRVSAAGEAADNFMWAYETTEPEFSALARHGAFNPNIARIDVMPAALGVHSPELPA